MDSGCRWNKWIDKMKRKSNNNNKIRIKICMLIKTLMLNVNVSLDIKLIMYSCLLEDNSYIIIKKKLLDLLKEKWSLMKIHSNKLSYKQLKI